MIGFLTSLFRSPVAPSQRYSASQNVGSRNEKSFADFMVDLLVIGVSTGLCYYITSETLKVLNSVTASVRPVNMVAQKKTLARRLNRPDVELLDFNEYESRLLDDVVGAGEIDVGFSDIGGMESELEDVKDNIVVPIKLWNMNRKFASVSPCPTGVLLYGSPGTGKSLTAKAIAKEAGATFINIKASSVMDKWFGESDKLVTALFTLGRKLAPSVIFIDEIETLLKKRDGGSTGSSPALHSMQGVFLAEWDGLSSTLARSPTDDDDQQLKFTPTGGSPMPGTNSKASAAPARSGPVVVLGATNRPNDLDKAFLRRMPVQIRTKVPDLKGRVAILKAQLSREHVFADLDVEDIALELEGCTGSDIRELIRVAAMQRTKACMREIEQSSALQTDVQLRPLSVEDFDYAVAKWRRTVEDSSRYNKNLEDQEFSNALLRQMQVLSSLNAATN